MLTEEQIRRLERLRNCWTNYEVEVALPDGRKMLVCYTQRRSLSGLLSAIFDRWQPISRVTGLPPDDPCAYRDKNRKEYVLEDGSVVRFSGRTQREAIISGELPYIGSPKS
jgi:hypothetical protein